MRSYCKARVSRVQSNCDIIITQQTLAINDKAENYIHEFIEIDQPSMIIYLPDFKSRSQKA